MKELFPIFKTYPNLVYLDSGATTQKPKVCIDSLSYFFTHYNANIHRGVNFLGNIATKSFEDSKKTIAEFFNTTANHILFTAGTTDAIFYASLLLEKDLKSGDEIVVSQLEHHANFIVWQQLALKKNLKLKVVEVDNDGIFHIEELLKALTNKTKLIAITHLSNVTGQIIHVKEIIKQAQKLDIATLIDGAQSVSKIKIDLQDLNPDFYSFSSHKLYGSTGLGVLYISPKYMNKNPERFGGGTIVDVLENKTEWIEGVDKHQPGTQPLAEIYALAKTLEWLRTVEYPLHEKEIHQLTLKTLKEIPDLKIIGQSDLGVISFTIKDCNPLDINDLLNEQKIAIRTGSHCALPFMHKMNLKAGTNRISLGLYNDFQDIALLKKALEKTIKVLK